MPGLAAAQALDLAERGARADRVRRGLLLHAAARPGDRAAAEDAALGDLERSAWALRRDSIGGEANAVATCRDCGSDLEFSLPADFAPPPRAADHADVVHGETTWRVRLPRAGDMRAGALRVERLAEGAPWSDDAFVAKVEAALDAADPGMDLRLALTCPDCGAAFEEPFDAVSYFWAEIEEIERRLIGEVAALARAYGWSEVEILGMSARRRALYLAEAEG